MNHLILNKTKILAKFLYSMDLAFKKICLIFLSEFTFLYFLFFDKYFGQIIFTYVFPIFLNKN